jgi:hypothetical protein
LGGWAYFIFIVYLALILLFAPIYYGIYLSDEAAFAFNSDIRNPRLEALRQGVEGRLAELAERREALTSLVAWLGTSKMPWGDTVSVAPSFRCTFSAKTDNVPRSGGMQMGTHTLTITNAMGATVFIDKVSYVVGLKPEEIDLPRHIRELIVK